MILSFILKTISIFFLAQYVPGIRVDSWQTAALVALVLGLLNITLVPLIKLLTLPLNFLTLGLLGFVINGLVILLVGQIVKGFSVESFVPALIFAVVLGVISGLLERLVD